MRTKSIPARFVPRKERKTRYYSFVRVNPKTKDYETLVDVCVGIGAYLGYKTVVERNKELLSGFVVTPHRVTVSGIAHLFPNFIFSDLIGDFNTKEAEMLLDESVVFLNAHRFASVRRRLTYLHVIPVEW